MKLFIDIIALIILVVSAGYAYYKGFVKTFFGFISTIVALIIACVLCNSVSMYIKDNTNIDNWIVTSITSIEIENGDDEIDIEEAQSGENDLLGIIDSLPSSITESLNFEETKNELKNSLALKVSDTVINVLSWLIIYVVVRVILLIVTIVFDGIMSIPFLRTINNLAGLILGTLMGVFRIYMILAIVYFISNIIDISGFVTAIQSSVVVSHMYNNNLLISLIF